MSTNKQDRRSIRLKGYDYSQPGGYFITICTHDRKCIFGEIVNGEMRLNEFGKIVLEEWNRTATIRPNIELDVFVVMPNHLHGVLFLYDICRGVWQDPDIRGRGVSQYAYRKTNHVISVPITYHWGNCPGV